MPDGVKLLEAAHGVQAQVCAALDALAASNTPDPEMAAWVREHVTRTLPLHVEDEERGLFPLLIARAQPQDRLPEIFAQIEAEHAESHLGLEALAEILLRLAEGDMAGPRCRAQLASHAAHERAHLAVEDATIMPLAAQRLTGKDRLALGRAIETRDWAMAEQGEP